MQRATLLIRRLGRFVRSCRDELGLTQAQMAARCDLSVKHFGQIERGDVEASLSALDCLARGLNVALPSLLFHVMDPGNGNRPVLDLRTWVRLQGNLHVLTDYVDRVVSYAQSVGGSQASRADAVRGGGASLDGRWR